MIDFFLKCEGTTGYYALRLRGASCCMQLVHDSKSATAQVNTAVVGGQKTENCHTKNKKQNYIWDVWSS